VRVARTGHRGRRAGGRSSPCHRCSCRRSLGVSRSSVGWDSTGFWCDRQLSPSVQQDGSDRLRAAAQSRFGERAAGDASEALSGRHRGDGTISKGDHQHAHYIAFGDPDGSDRRIRGLVTWAPNGGEGLTGLEIAALQAVDRLRPAGYRKRGNVTSIDGPNAAAEAGADLVTVPGIRPVRLVAVAAGPVGEIAPELCGIGGGASGGLPAAREWVSWTPYAPVHFPRRRVRSDEEWREHVRGDVLRELSHRPSLPDEALVEFIPGDWLSFRRYRPGRSLSDAVRATGIRLIFAEPVAGPLALGALSHFGLGLFRPVAA
jgi:CRISPR-associated protein Csb2